MLHSSFNNSSHPIPSHLDDDDDIRYIDHDLFIFDDNTTSSFSQYYNINSNIMEVNKEEAMRCRTIGSDALRNSDYPRAIKMFTKSLHLYPLPGVQALLDQAERKLQQGQQQQHRGQRNHANNNAESEANSTNGTNSNSTHRPASAAAAAASASRSSSSSSLGADGRAYTPSQASVVTQVLKSKEGGRGAHYRVLGIPSNADDAAIKKAYRQLALKLHPDKNSAPHADEAFKAVGLAYATLSDSQKRRIYDLSGEEDPDNRGGGGMRRGGGANFNGQDVSPEDIFNMFFGGGMPPGAGGGGGGMGNGFRVYSTGFGPGMAFGGMHPHMRARQQQQQRQRQQQQQADGILGTISQLLPLIMILLFSFFNMSANDSTGGATGGSRYFSLTPIKPHVNPLSTKITHVKDIPFYVSDQFLRTIARDRYQLSQVERMVERSYESYLMEECKNQKLYKRRLEKRASSTHRTLKEEERLVLKKKAEEFELSRCMELEDLFPASVPEKDRVKRHTEF
ncbi:hypothetical protein ACHAXH_006519 [Discostella pseudostelligera]